MSAHDFATSVSRNPKDPDATPPSPRSPLAHAVPPNGAPDLDLDLEVSHQDVLAHPPQIASSSADAPGQVVGMAGCLGSQVGTAISLPALLDLGPMLAPALKRHFYSKWSGPAERNSGCVFSVSLSDDTLPRVSSLSSILKSSLAVVMGAKQELPLSMQPDGSSRLYFTILRMHPGRISFCGLGLAPFGSSLLRTLCSGD